jgi:RNA polymerase sigma-70 factor (ECF subfamily)
VSYKCRRSGWVGALESRKVSREEVTRLYHEHGPALLAYASSFVADRGRAEDLLHQVFAKLLEGGMSLPDVPAAYLYRAVRNAALNTRRNGFRETALDATNACFVHRGGDNEAALALQVALADLPDEQREVVVMRVWSGMTLDEVAAATGVSLNTVASRYRYALQKLREKLKPFQRTEEL